MDHLEYLPAGDALIRRAAKYGDRTALVMRLAHGLPRQSILASYFPLTLATRTARRTRTYSSSRYIRPVFQGRGLRSTEPHPLRYPKACVV